jgi:hypothetical protein
MSQTLDKKLYTAINALNDKQKKAVLTMMKAFTEQKQDARWEGDDFVVEMEKRYDGYKSGKTKLISLDEVEKKARNAAQKIRRKKAS